MSKMMFAYNNCQDRFDLDLLLKDVPSLIHFSSPKVHSRCLCSGSGNLFRFWQRALSLPLSHLVMFCLCRMKRVNFFHLPTNH